jgi:hypothetical protein
VSDGAISFYLDHFVRTRVSKITYGNFCHIPYDPSDADHQRRSHKIFTSVSGNKRISDCFDIILPKVSYIPFFNGMSAKTLYCRIRKFRRRKNSKNLISGNQPRQLISKLAVFLFGVIVETLHDQSGKTLITVRAIISSLVSCDELGISFLQIITPSFVL